jgi:xylulokinase
MPADPLLIGLDIGTTSIKAIVFDLHGQTVAQTSLRTPTHYPRPGWAYFEPEELWQTTVQALRTAVVQVEKPERIRGIGVASFAETGVPIDAHGQAASPEAIAWFDNRTAAQAVWLEKLISQERLFAITGISLQPIFGLFKLLWLRDNQPEVFARTRLWLNMADYITYRLSGVPATDFSLASRMMGLDLHRLQWSEEILSTMRIAPSMLAPLQPSGTRLGPVLPDVAAATGLPTNTQVAVGGHDHVCGALALGVTEPGDVLNSMGTAEAIFLPLAKPLTDPQIGAQGYAQGVHVGGNYYVLGGMYTSGACVDWFRESCTIGADTVGADYATLIQEAEQIPPGSLGAFFLPHMRMANPPHLDVLARGSFIGLRTDVKRGALFRAVLEGLAYEIRNTLEPLLTYTGLPRVRNIYVTGGGAYNELMMRIKASVLNHTLTVVSVKEATALGAALLGGVGAGVYADLPSALGQLRYTQEEVKPGLEDAKFYDAGFHAVYVKLYDALRPLHHAVHTLQKAE